MSRHRIVRAMDYNDEYDGYEDIYGHSVDDDSCISPTDAKQWLYDRSRGQLSTTFIRSKDVEEEIADTKQSDESDDGDVDREKRRRDFQMPMVGEIEHEKLTSCIDGVRSLAGDTTSEARIAEKPMRFGYDITKVLEDIIDDKCTNGEAKHWQNQSKPSTSTTSHTQSYVTKNKTPDRDIRSLQQQQQHQQEIVTPSTRVKVTASEIRRGFDIASSHLQASPVASGRNTPEESEDAGKAAAAGFKVSKEQVQRNPQQLYMKERAQQKTNFNLIVIGHVDAGKSTLMGHLLYDTGNVSQRIMHKYEQESKKLGKQSFVFAWVLDETGEERSRGITMDVGHSRFETETKIVTLLDAPGHKDFIPNMISGATQADVALLVVDATRGEFETGFEQGGQTREHALLVRSLGVNQLGVVINKLDTVNWSKERFDEIVSKLKGFLKQAGFRESDVSFVPCSGLTGENLTKPASAPELKAWYDGPYLLSVIENFKVPERSVSKPFRMSVSDVFKGATGGSGVCIAGRIESGVLSINDRVLVGASREQAQVKGVLIDDYPQTNAFAGDQVSITLAGIDAANNVTVGCIICDPQNPVPVTSRFHARILVFNLKVPMTIGFPVLLHHQSFIEPAIIRKLIALIHKGSGEIVKKKPRCLGNNSCAEIELETSRPICIERYADFKELGRFMLRVNGVTIAAGMVTSIR